MHGRRASGPNTTTVIGKLSLRASAAIVRLCHEAESPWLIVTSSGGAGVLVGFDDRAAIVKTGVLTSFMAGSLGGERSASFHFADITGIEYNSGFLNGVLEILTPSYSGTASHDFWRGAAQKRNAAAADPWTLSNALPLQKSEYNSALPHINHLRSRIAESKSRGVAMAVPMVEHMAGIPPETSLSHEIERLAELHQTGLLSDEEFASAKAAAIARFSG